jgi:hypothetical protein
VYVREYLEKQTDFTVFGQKFQVTDRDLKEMGRRGWGTIYKQIGVFIEN